MNANLNLARFRLLPSSLLLALGLLIVCSGLVTAQQTTRARPKTRRPPKVRPTPAATPTPAPTPTPSPSPTASPSPNSTPTVTPNPPVPPVNAKLDVWGAKAEGSESFMRFCVEMGVIAMVLWLFIPGYFVKKTSEQLGGKQNWSIVFVILAAIVFIFFLIGYLLGSANSQSAPAGDSGPLPGLTTSPNQTQAPTPSPTSPPPPESPTPSSTVSPIPSPFPSLSPSPTQPIAGQVTLPPTAATTPIPTPFPLSVAAVKVEGQDEKDKSAGLGDVLIIKINNLMNELDRGKALPPASEPIDPTKYVLFLADTEMKKLYPEGLDPETGSLRFRLSRTPESKDAWGNLLAYQGRLQREVKASAGPEGKMPFPQGQDFTLKIYDRRWLLISLIFFLLLMYAFTVAARKTNIVREPRSYESLPPTSGLYSLARVQLTWWFFIILGSFLFIGLMTRDFDIITTSALVLLGIGTGTALGAVVVDAKKRNSINSALATLKEQTDKLAENIDGLEQTISDREEQEADQQSRSLKRDATKLITRRRELDAKRAQLQALEVTSRLEGPVSKGFINDITGDANGISFHRVQMIACTMILGGIFVWSVGTRLRMPEFSITLLILMGISAGTYLGFEIPERQTSPGMAPHPLKPESASSQPPAGDDHPPESQPTNEPTHGRESPT